MTAVALLGSELFNPRFGLTNRGFARIGVTALNWLLDSHRAAPAIMIPVFIGFHPGKCANSRSHT